MIFINNGRAKIVRDVFFTRNVYMSFMCTYSYVKITFILHMHIHGKNHIPGSFSVVLFCLIFEFYNQKLLPNALLVSSFAPKDFAEHPTTTPSSPMQLTLEIEVHIVGCNSGYSSHWQTLIP